jgi:hypothetical protein
MESDWTGGRYLGIYLHWDYKNGTVTLTMPEYVKNALHQYQHVAPKQNIHSPSKYTSPDQTTRFQQVTGKFRYYARAIDGTMMHGLNNLSTQTTTGTQVTAAEIEHCLNYCATNPDSALLYRASNMVLMNDSDAAYLVAPGAKSCAGGHTYFGNRPDNPDQIINGAVLHCPDHPIDFSHNWSGLDSQT